LCSFLVEPGVARMLLGLADASFEVGTSVVAWSEKLVGSVPFWLATRLVPASSSAGTAKASSSLPGAWWVLAFWQRELVQPDAFGLRLSAISSFCFFSLWASILPSAARLLTGTAGAALASGASDSGVWWPPLVAGFEP